MKKLTLAASHTDIVNIISELILLECLEPTEPIIELDPPELTSLLRREVMELSDYGANYESIVVFATQYTYILSGWLPVEYESELTTMLGTHICAWDIIDPYPYDYDDIPVLLKFPQLFTKMRSGGRRVFEPLSKANGPSY
ncbi:MAG: hypothetical protein FWH17_07740 [Oscillospiraceae bacterium]|nr:hypothetical protein [Oscillospiraceae bacterium]